MKFEKNDIIVHDRKNWTCIVADYDVAVFARIHKVMDEDKTWFTSVNYDDTFAVVNNSTDDNFEYTIITDSWNDSKF